VSEEELDAARWMQLLDEVREELGEGTVAGIAFGRRLEFSSSLGDWDLSLVDGRLGHWTQYRFFGKTAFPAAFYLGPVPDVNASEKWVEIETGDPAFDAECSIWTGAPDAVRRMLSDAVRRSIEALWTFHPSLTLLVHSKEVKIVLPGVLVERAGIIDLLMAAGEFVEELRK
jgi:hypothetical protein